MPTLPAGFTHTMMIFAPLFSKRVWRWAVVLVAGAILATGARTGSAALRVMGLSHERHFQNYHRVLNRAVWSPLAASRRLLRVLVDTFVPQGPVLLGLDDTIERRWGDKIRARGIYRDPVRSSRSHFVKTSGLRWLSVMLLAPIPWVQRVWALPFLTALCPSEGYAAARGRPHKTLTDWARQLLLQVRRWLPGRRLVVVADSSFAALELLSALRQHLTVITRLRLDAALYAPAPPRRPGQQGRPRCKGDRLPTLAQVLVDPDTVWQRLTVAQWYGEHERPIELASGTAVWYHKGLPVVPIRWLLVRDPLGRFEPQAFLCTDLDVSPLQALEWFLQSWQLEVTFEEARAHLGVETQRQWSHRAIARTTPALLALYSLVTLLAHRHHTADTLSVRSAAWYAKTQPTFSDALARVRRDLWRHPHTSPSHGNTDSIKIPRALFDRLTDTLCYAA